MVHTHCRRLRTLGAGQGYNFARPLDAETITQLLDDRSPSDSHLATNQPEGDPVQPIPSSG
jgi:hypothetical protein